MHKMEIDMSETKVKGPNTPFKTSDLYYAAYLKVAGVPFLGTKREENRVFFLFEDSETMGDLRLQYFNRHAKVVAMTYAEEIKAMKALTFA